jgi:uncharacterized membrane protein
MDTVPSASPLPPPAPAVVASEDKTVAIVAYFTLIGFIVAIVLHGNKKTKLGAYHLRQMLGLILTSFAAGIIMAIPVLGWLLIIPLWIFLLVLWIPGLMAAINGQMKPTLLLGEHYQKWFGTAFE